MGMDMGAESVDELCINTIRFLAVDAIEKANSGHPGTPMGAAPMAYVLWDRFLKHNPGDPKLANRDRFVLSAGHASMLLYSLLYLTGYDLSLEDIKQFRQWGSRTPGHPEYGLVPGVEATTGPLGQGFANGVGMAIAEKWLAEHYNRPGHEIINHTYSHPNNEELNPSQKMNRLSYDEQKEEIVRCHEVCMDILKYEPVGFRTPHFGKLHSEAIYDILQELGYCYSSSTAAICVIGFGAPFMVKGFFEIPGLL